MSTAGEFTCAVRAGADAVKADPAKCAAGRPNITVSSATDADAALIKRQAKCPVMDEPLGSMGQPIKVMVGDKPIFLCCKGCIKKIQAEPAKYLAMVYGNSPGGQASASATSVVPAGGQQVRAGVFKVTAADAPFIAAQKRCPVMDEPLDAMGGPYKVNAAGKAIYICCPGCAIRSQPSHRSFSESLPNKESTHPCFDRSEFILAHHIVGRIGFRCTIRGGGVLADSCSHTKRRHAAPAFSHQTMDSASL